MHSSHATMITTTQIMFCFTSIFSSLQIYSPVGYPFSIHGPPHNHTVWSRSPIVQNLITIKHKRMREAVTAVRLLPDFSLCYKPYSVLMKVSYCTTAGTGLVALVISVMV